MLHTHITYDCSAILVLQLRSDLNIQGTNQDAQMNPAYQLSQVRDIPASFPGLRVANICLRKLCFVHHDIKSTADLS